MITRQDIQDRFVACLVDTLDTPIDVDEATDNILDIFPLSGWRRSSGATISHPDMDATDQRVWPAILAAERS